MTPTIDIIIPTYNGKDLLEKNLKEVISQSKNAKKIIIIDDCSTDGTVDYLKDKFPQIEIIFNNKNLGFTRSINKAVKHSKSKLFVLLNNDVIPLDGYLEGAIDYFKNKNIFAVSFNEQNSSWPVVSWSHGKLQFIQSPDKTKDVYSAWASGGSAIFSRSIWKKLGGFNPIYSPGYWEDIDLCWRAWAKGYSVVWSKKSKVVHNHQSTFSRLNKKFVSDLKQINELLFNWQNFSCWHSTSDILSTIVNTLRHPGYFRIIILAFIKYLKFGKNTIYKVSKKAIFETINTPYYG